MLENSSKNNFTQHQMQDHDKKIKEYGTTIKIKIKLTLLIFVWNINKLLKHKAQSILSGECMLKSEISIRNSTESSHCALWKRKFTQILFRNYVKFDQVRPNERVAHTAPRSNMLE